MTEDDDYPYGVPHSEPLKEWLVCGLIILEVVASTVAAWWLW